MNSSQIRHFLLRLDRKFSDFWPQKMFYRLSVCIDAVHSWMRSNRLRLYSCKSELFCSATAHWQHQLIRTLSTVGPDTIVWSTAVRDVGIFTDSYLSTQTHVLWTIAGCFAVMHQLQIVRRFVSSSVYQSLVVALVLSRLLYITEMLLWLACLLHHLQCILNV